MANTKKTIQRGDSRKFIWEDDKKEVDIIRYDDKARNDTIKALLAESRAMLKNS